MLFRVLITGVFTGTIAAVTAFSQGLGPIAAFLAYAVFAGFAVIGMGVLTIAAPMRPVSSHQWKLDRSRDARALRIWHPLSQGTRSPYWQERLERMARQTIGAQSKPVTFCVFSSVRRNQPTFR
ncbi:hypothetical protein ALP8811_00576 [Aliiroseovarius pelagivivens]|uniref:Uncharacterized protein n=1 Tax=Aliiroseovarius pelagivivens TaxID=1639690 RepID=A0A2R8AHQ9_9RHOB|nr:hypothetical protein [Aliiroseovarius pelagivivens]SPF75583.1 hypothetical protein ALP8811_00576 [Aliiroseovarius pelagivivens]